VLAKFQPTVTNATKGHEEVEDGGDAVPLREQLTIAQARQRPCPPSHQVVLRVLFPRADTLLSGLEHLPSSNILPALRPSLLPRVTPSVGSRLTSRCRPQSRGAFVRRRLCCLCAGWSSQKGVLVGNAEGVSSNVAALRGAKTGLEVGVPGSHNERKSVVGAVDTTPRRLRRQNSGSSEVILPANFALKDVFEGFIGIEDAFSTYTVVLLVVGTDHGRLLWRSRVISRCSSAPPQRLPSHEHTSIFASRVILAGFPGPLTRRPLMLRAPLPLPANSWATGSTHPAPLAGALQVVPLPSPRW
jgi:hypothetical protein